MRFLIIFLFLISNTFANEVPEIKNIKIHKNLQRYNDLVFLDQKKNELDLKNFKGKLILLNFWATWCAPCREEMPSLDKLQIDEELENLKIFPINVGQEKISKSEDFYKDYKIKNLDIYHDQSLNLPNKFLLRGLPTTIFIDKNGLEFARAVGSIDFQNEKFINWLKKYD